MRDPDVPATATPSAAIDALAANALLDRELRRVRRVATMLHDRRSVCELAAYERELEAQLARTSRAADLLDTTLRRLG
ncbi:hypothetical protein ACMGDM_05235 [Sphingomonas sp. DT-51]|uniref:hypothetical protein n=1 Tax=Sphingomonas sp. DT-51 TaxID=3396165 RepID=UPI003F1B2A78